MTDHSTPDQIRSAISALLETRAAGDAVATKLNDDYRAWQDRAVVCDLRAQRAIRHARRAVAEAEDQSQIPQPLRVVQ